MKINFIYLICLLPLVSFSQITIQQSALPVVGNAWASYDDNGTSSVNISPPGPAQNWYFSTGWLVGQPIIDNFIDPASLNGYSLFPGSNVAEQESSANATINYFFRNDPSGLFNMGSFAFDTASNIHKTFDTNLNVLHTPFTYGNNITDTIKEEMITIYAPLQQQPAEKNITISFLNHACDAWGTVTTPCYQNPVDVIRIRSQYMGTIDSTFIDSTGTGAGPWTFYSAVSHLGPATEISWNFFQNNSPCIVLSIETDTNINVFDAQYYCDTLLSNIIGCGPNHLNNIFPNPAAGEFVHIRIPGTSVRNITIYDLSGSIVKEIDASGKNTINLSTEYFQNGIYFCVYFDGDKKRVYTEKFIVNK